MRTYYVLPTISFFISFLIFSLSVAPSVPEVPTVESDPNKPDAPKETDENKAEATSMNDTARAEELKKFFEEWEQHMKGFNPSNLLNFELAAGETKNFYEHVSQVPAILRGAYSVSEKDTNKVLVKIYGTALGKLALFERKETWKLRG